MGGKIYLTIFLLFMANVGYASTQLPFSVMQYIERIKQTHPKIMAADVKIASANFGVEAARGTFDPVFNQQSRVRPFGYYDGAIASQTLSQQLQYQGIKMYTGYRISSGDFPSYDANLETLDGGELSVGVNIPLMQNRQTDKYRTQLANAREDTQYWRANYAISINDTLYRAMLALLKWHEASLRHQMVSQLVETTEARFAGIKTRVDSGDLPAISITEFNGILMKRKRALLQAEQLLVQTRQHIQLYWRDKNGEMMPLSAIPETLETLDWPYHLSDEALRDLETEIVKHPKLTAISAEIHQAKNLKQLKNDQLKPRFDLELKLSRDIGQGEQNLRETEGYVGIQFAMPLGMRSAKAEHSQANEKLREKQYAFQGAHDELRQAFARAITSYRYGQTLLAMNRQQATIADKLVGQENTRFQAGASDLFVLNSRETSAIEANLNMVSAHIKLKESELAVWAAAGKMAEVNVQ